jgi:hypothetical protein
LIAGYIGVSGQLPNEFPEFRKRRERKAKAKLRSKLLPNYARKLQEARVSSPSGMQWAPNIRYADIRSAMKVLACLKKHGINGGDIFTAYEKSDGQLLVLGAAGVGKTYALLTLFAELVRRGKENMDEPMPFYLELADWHEGKNLDAWIVESIHARFGVRKDFIADWIDDDDLVLICDGLDEMPRRRRQGCISAINIFRKSHGLLPVVIACRTEEYRTEPRELSVKGVVKLDLLDMKAAQGMVNSLGRDYTELKSVMRRDKALADLLRIPLFMSLAIRVFYQRQTSDGPARRNTRAWKNAIIDAYIDDAAARGQAQFPAANLGVDTWLPRLLLIVDRDHNSTLLPDRIPQSILNDDLIKAAKRLAGWWAVVIVLTSFLLIRFPLLIFADDAGGPYPYFLATLVVGAATAYHMRGLTIETLHFAPSGRRPVIGRSLKRIVVRWTMMYALLSASVTSVGSAAFSGSTFIQVAYIIAVGFLAAYPAFALFNISNQGDFDGIPSQPGQETRMLLITSLTCAGVTTVSLFASLALAAGPMVLAGIDFTPVAFPLMLPYFALPFSLIAAFRHGGAEWLVRKAAQRVATRCGMLPKPYWRSFLALRSSSLLTPSGGGYVIIHSLVRDRLIERIESVE